MAAPTFSDVYREKYLLLTTFTKDGKPKLVERCSLPLTGVGCVTTVYTSLAVIDIKNGRFVLREKLPSISLEDLQAVTGARLVVRDTIGDLIVPEL